MGWGMKNQMHKNVLILFMFGLLFAVLGAMIIFNKLVLFNPSKSLGWLLLFVGLVFLYLGYKIANKVGKIKMDFNPINFVYIGLFLFVIGMMLLSIIPIFSYILISLGLILIVGAIVLKFRKKKEHETTRTQYNP